MTSAAVPPSPLSGPRERLGWMLAVSLAAHVALIGFGLWRSSRTPAIDLDQKPIVARLVRRGELRPKELLPRKEAAPPPAPRQPDPPPAPAPSPPAPAAPAVAAPAPQAAPAKPAAPAAKGPAPKNATGDALASALSRIEKDARTHGNPDGHELGDADEGEGDQYLALVTQTLKERYDVWSIISEKERMHLRAAVLLFIEPDGRISRHQFRSRSGNGLFDGAVERAIQAARLPPPPPEKRELFRSQGLLVDFVP